MSTVPAGWYPDPEQPNLQRYWDGTQWTEHVQDVPLFDAEMQLTPTPLVKSKTKRLVVTNESMWWGEEQVRWDEVTWFNQQTTVMHGIPYAYVLNIQLGDRVMTVEFAARTRRKGIGDQANTIIINQLYSTLGLRVINGLLQMVAEGQPVRTGGLLFAPEGFAHEANGQELIPWSEFAGLEVGGHEGLFVRLYRSHEGGKRKMVVRAPIDIVRGWAIPPVVEEHARRYAGA